MLRSGNATLADTATNATQLGGASASHLVQTNDRRLTESCALEQRSMHFAETVRAAKAKALK